MEKTLTNEQYLAELRKTVGIFNEIIQLLEDAKAGKTTYPPEFNVTETSDMMQELRSHIFDTALDLRNNDFSKQEREYLDEVLEGF